MYKRFIHEVTVQNAGVIAGDNTLVTTTSGAYTYIRFPGLAAGVLLQAGGVITNQAGGVTIVIPGHENVTLPHEMAHAVKVEKRQALLNVICRRP